MAVADAVRTYSQQLQVQGLCKVTSTTYGSHQFCLWEGHSTNVCVYCVAHADNALQWSTRIQPVGPAPDRCHALHTICNLHAQGCCCPCLTIHAEVVMTASVACLAC